VPNVTAALATPLAPDPDSTGMGRTHVVSTDPDVAMAIPAMEAFYPHPIAVCTGGSRNDFDGPGWRRPNADNELGICDAGREQHGSGGGEKISFQVHPLLLCYSVV